MNTRTFKVIAITATVVFVQATALAWCFKLVFVPEPTYLAESYDIDDIDAKVIRSDLPPKLIYRSNQPVSFSEKEFSCLARNIYYEAGTESHAGKLAVAQVTYNRLQSGRWGQTVCSVVYADSQFSWTKNPKKRHVKPHGPLWHASVQAARDFIAGHRVFELDRSQHYHADYVNPNWGRDEHRIRQIGRHIFYDLSGPVSVAEIQQ